VRDSGRGAATENDGEVQTLVAAGVCRLEEIALMNFKT